MALCTFKYENEFISSPFQWNDFALCEFRSKLNPTLSNLKTAIIRLKRAKSNLAFEKWRSLCVQKPILQMSLEPRDVFDTLRWIHHTQNRHTERWISTRFSQIFKKRALAKFIIADPFSSDDIARWRDPSNLRLRLGDVSKRLKETQRDSETQTANARLGGSALADSEPTTLNSSVSALFLLNECSKHWSSPWRIP